MIIVKNYISENIRKYRKLKGFTQEELACELGVTSQAVSRWEAGNGMPDISFIVPLAQNLGITTDMLFGMSDAVYDKEMLDEIRANVAKMKAIDNSGEGLIKICEYIKTEIESNPTCYELYVMYVENAAWISAKVDFEGFLEDEPEKWDKMRSEAIRKATVVIKHAKDRKLVDKAHFTVAWIYIHSKAYDEAREHIEALPSLRTNMVQERILDKLALFEGGPGQDFDRLRAIMESSMDKYMEAIAAKMIYDMETYSFKADKEFAASYGNWAIKVLELFGERYSSDRLILFKDKINEMF